MSITKDFMTDVNNYFFERMMENEDETLIDKYPSFIEAFEACASIEDSEEKSEMIYCIQSPLIDATENMVLNYLEAHDLFDWDDYDGADIDCGFYTQDEAYDGDPYVSMRIKTHVRIYADYSLSMLKDEKLLETALQETLDEALKNMNEKLKIG